MHEHSCILQVFSFTQDFNSSVCCCLLQLWLWITCEHFLSPEQIPTIRKEWETRLRITNLCTAGKPVQSAKIDEGMRVLTNHKSLHTIKPLLRINRYYGTYSSVHNVTFCLKFDKNKNASVNFSKKKKIGGNQQTPCSKPGLGAAHFCAPRGSLGHSTTPQRPADQRNWCMAFV